MILQLRESRKILLDIPKNKLKGAAIAGWFSNSENLINQADSVSKQNLRIKIWSTMHGSETENNVDVCLDLRMKIIDLIDNSIKIIDSNQIVKPVLEVLISQIADTKLSTLLLEFNSCSVDQPNIASVGFRTILPLIIRERAKIVDPTDSLAVKDDIGFEIDINKAIRHPALFNEAEKKLLKRYIDGGKKDSFDNVVHKPDYLIDKSELDDAVDLLNRLLPTIV